MENINATTRRYIGYRNVHKSETIMVWENLRHSSITFAYAIFPLFFRNFSLKHLLLLYWTLCYASPSQLDPAFDEIFHATAHYSGLTSSIPNQLAIYFQFECREAFRIESTP